MAEYDYIKPFVDAPYKETPKPPPLPEKFDSITRPAHYVFSNIEPLDAILEWKLDYLLGNVVKYVVRAGRKTSDPRQDLKKALYYLNRRLQEYEAGMAAVRKPAATKCNGQCDCC